MNGQNRRPTTITAAIAAALVLVFASLAVVVVIYAWPRPAATGVANSDVIVRLATPLSDLQAGQAIRFEAPSDRSFVMIDGGGFKGAGHRPKTGWLANTDQGLVALAADSSHLGCPVYFDAAFHGFTDPCGGSAYNIYGQVLHGPAARALAHLAFRVVAANEIAVKGIGVSNAQP